MSSVSLEDQATIVNLCSYYGLLFFLATDFACVSMAVFFVIRAFHNHTYQYLASPRVLKDYYEGLLKHYQGSQAQDAEALAAKEFDDYLLIQFVEAAERNDGLNQKRKMFIHLATRYCIASIALLGVTFIPFVFTGKSDSTLTKIKGFGEPLTIRVQGGTPIQEVTREETRHAGTQTKQPGQFKAKSGQPTTSNITQAASTASATNQGERGQIRKPKVSR